MDSLRFLWDLLSNTLEIASYTDADVHRRIAESFIDPDTIPADSDSDDDDNEEDDDEDKDDHDEDDEDSMLVSQAAIGRLCAAGLRRAGRSQRPGQSGATCI